jgi:hypothetical protein
MTDLDLFTCTACTLDLPGDSFTTTIDGTRRPTCRACFAQAMQELHGRNPHGYARRDSVYRAALSRQRQERAA